MRSLTYPAGLGTCALSGRWSDLQYENEFCYDRWSRLSGLAAGGVRSRPRDDDVHRQSHKFSGERGEALGFTFRVAVFNNHILAVDPAGVAKPSSKRFDKGARHIR